MKSEPIVCRSDTSPRQRVSLAIADASLDGVVGGGSMSQRALLLLPGKARRRWQKDSRKWSSWRVVMRARHLGTAVAAVGKLGTRKSSLATSAAVAAGPKRSETAVGLCDYARLPTSSSA